MTQKGVEIEVWSIWMEVRKYQSYQTPLHVAIDSFAAPSSLETISFQRFPGTCTALETGTSSNSTSHCCSAMTSFTLLVNSGSSLYN